MSNPHTFILACVMCLSAVAIAARQNPTANAAAPGGATPFTTRGAFIGVSVADMDASVAWYSEKLGLTVVTRHPRVEQSQAVVLEGGGLIVELMKHDDAVPLGKAAPAITRNYLVHGIFKAGIVVDDFDKTISQLKARGVQIAIGPFPATKEQRANAIIRDNAGNFIQFFGATP
jgi:catechol 2,3-dioxygenase-like lactoylglutathione lyase family enzyme